MSVGLLACDFENAGVMRWCAAGSREGYIVSTTRNCALPLIMRA